MLTVVIQHGDRHSTDVLTISGEGREPIQIPPGGALAVTVEPGQAFQVARHTRQAAATPPAGASEPAGPLPAETAPAAPTGA